jgi:hypothetical protein
MKPFSRTFFFFHDWIPATTKPFSRIFFFFHDGILAITKPFSRTFFFFFHDGISAITKPFSRIFFFFHDGIPAITKPFLRTFFFFHDGIFFHDWTLEIRNLGEDSFYTYITKSIYIGSASLKTLRLDLEPPLQGKEYGPSYSNTTRKSKANFSPEITYGHVIRIFGFLEYKLAKMKKLLYITSSCNSEFHG